MIGVSCRFFYVLQPNLPFDIAYHNSLTIQISRVNDSDT